ncbi:MAG: hypothetical protein JJU06_01980 [Ectothiorhodospiraceae bacterium]|nr:hypothetical protein [Ectothiorhodospiraceae bacterium]MCH8503292.1 hypothetical protein [Ectothiorhodospiraceae bacterium]
MLLGPGKAYDEIHIGEIFGAAMTVTEAHLVIGAGMFGDFNPIHVNESFGQASRFGKRILHGPLSGAMVSAPLGNYFGGAVVAYLEHNCRFIAPVTAGDTITTYWTIVDKLDKPRQSGGIAMLEAESRNQNRELVLTAAGKMLVLNREACTNQAAALA